MTPNQPNYGGVPHMLLDYLVATSLFLVTDVEEYIHRPGQDVSAARSAIDAFLPPALRNKRNGRGSYVSTESCSPMDSNKNISSPHNISSLADDTRSITSEAPSTPSSTILQYHHYSFFHFAALDPDIPPVPEVPPEHQASVPPILPRTPTLPTLPTLGRLPTVWRRLPRPPVHATPITPAPTEQPWSRSSAHSTPELTLPADSPDSPMSIPTPLPTPPQRSRHLRWTGELSRSSASVNRRQLPPQRQPPQLLVPIPPKLIDDIARSISPSATSSDGVLSSTGDASGQASDPSTSIHDSALVYHFVIVIVIHS